MTGQDGSRIVVGVDGSQSSQEALEWAVRQAHCTGAAVEAVLAWHYPVSYGWVVTQEDPGLKELAGKVLADAVSRVQPLAPDVTIRARIIEQNPAQALIDEAAGADLLVVGSRGHGGFVGALLGSVSQHCVHHSPCPVVVIRGPADGQSTG